MCLGPGEPRSPWPRGVHRKFTVSTRRAKPACLGQSGQNRCGGHCRILGMYCGRGFGTQECVLRTGPSEKTSSCLICRSCVLFSQLIDKNLKESWCSWKVLRVWKAQRGYRLPCCFLKMDCTQVEVVQRETALFQSNSSLPAATGLPLTSHVCSWPNVLPLFLPFTHLPHALIECCSYKWCP